jgi:hypothetical protein
MSCATGFGKQLGQRAAQVAAEAHPGQIGKDLVHAHKPAAAIEERQPMGALASIESSSESVSLSPARCSAIEATMRLNASIRSPISLCTCTGKGKLPLSSGAFISAACRVLRTASGPEMDASHQQHQQGGGRDPDEPKIIVLRRIDSNSSKSQFGSVSTQA